MALTTGLAGPISLINREVSLSGCVSQLALSGLSSHSSSAPGGALLVWKNARRKCAYAKLSTALTSLLSTRKATVPWLMAITSSTRCSIGEIR